MKPYGLTSSLEIAKPTRAMDMLWDAVEQAIEEGMSVRDIKMEMREAWEHCYREKAKEGAELTK